MLYRRFGKTELQMPVFSCGGMRYQYKWQDVPMAEVPADHHANLEATIRRAVDLGINHIETARGYGSSERQLGMVLPKFPRDHLIVQTKIGPSEDPAEFTANFEDSLKRLRLDYVDLLGLHGLNNDETLDRAIRPGGCLAAARRLQQRGLVRHVGFSTHAPLDVLLQAVTHEQDGGFDYVNLHWYYIFQHNWPAIEAATQRDMGVFIISPSDKGGRLYDPPQRLIELCRPLHPMAFNDLFCLWHEQVHTLSLGAARPSDFDLHVEALESINHLDELLPPVIERLHQAWTEAVGEELADPFNLGLPGCDEAPGGMNVAVILWLRGLARAYDMETYARGRYNLLGNAGHWFPGNNAAEADTMDLGDLEDHPVIGGRLRPLLIETHEMLGGEAVARQSRRG